MTNPYESPKAEPHDTAAGPPRPVWVQLGLWGLPNRAWALAFMWFSLLLAGACGILGAWYPRATAGVGFVFAALWYWAAVRWVDRHGGWHATGSSKPNEDTRRH